MNGIWFDGVHSHTDLNMVLTSVDVPPAKAKTKFVDIPAGDGSIDLTEALGMVRFKNREAKFVFTLFPWDDFEEKKRIVSNLLNGRRVKIIVDKDPDFYWLGRCSVNEYASDKNIRQITVGATLEPYKFKHAVTTVTVGAGTHRLHNSRKPVVPSITCQNAATIAFGGATYNLTAGEHTLANVCLVEGDNTITVTSTGTVTFTYQEGDL